MTAQEFKKCFALASNKNLDLSNEDIQVFDGFGLKDFQPVVATNRQLAALMRYQALYISGGGWDNEALQEIRDCLRYKLTLVEV